MEVLIYILAIYGLAFLLKESDGPWGLIALGRNKLMTNPHVGVFFYELLNCYFCLGFHCGWFVYLLWADEWHLQFLFLWGLAGGTICLILDAVIVKLTAPPPSAS
jgi:hypothetical protein